MTQLGQIRLATLVIGLLVMAGHAALACSLVPRSLFEKYQASDKVFLGTVKQRLKDAAEGQGVYRIVVKESFKGLPAKGKWGGELEATISEREQCGLGAGKPDDVILVFMRDGKVVSTTDGSFLVWQETAETGANLNPVMDDIIALRRMLYPLRDGEAPVGIVPDEASAKHIALQAMVPVFGKEMVTKNQPFIATQPKNELKNYDGVDWVVEGTLYCPKEAKTCRGGVLRAEINRWNGQVVRVMSGD